VSYPGIHSVLFLAIDKKLESLSRELIKRDDRLGALDDRQRSVLWHSADQGLEKTSALLISSGKIDLNQQDVNGHSALSQAIAKGHTDIASLLMRAQVDVGPRTREGNSLLMLAVLARKPVLVKMLLTREIDANAQNNLGDTALIMAAASAQTDVIEMLITAGADLQLRNKEDLNAFQVASGAGHRQAAELIHEHSNIIFKLFN
jgi:ankyrin repeat protein